jgi:hypothetical protein
VYYVQFRQQQQVNGDSKRANEKPLHIYVCYGIVVLMDGFFATPIVGVRNTVALINVHCC